MILLRTTDDARPLALIWHYTCHPTAVVPDSVISADYPGTVRRALRECFGEIPCVFLQGFCGDIRPNITASQKAGWGQRIRRIFRTIASGPLFASPSAADWLRWSRSLGAGVADIAEHSPVRRFSAMSLRAGSARIPLDEFFRGSVPDKPLQASVLRIGEDLEIVALSAEACVGWTSILDEAVPTPPDRIRLYTGYLGALFGYLPTAAQIPEGGYEVEGFQPLFGLSGRFDSGQIGRAVTGCVKRAFEDLEREERAPKACDLPSAMIKMLDTMTEEALASRRFGMDDQIAFARLSSDFNPMHLDRAFARRTQFGAPVVHGIHNLAWAANAVLHRHPLKVDNIRARFLQPLFLDEPAEVRIRARTQSQIEFEVAAAGTVVARVKLSAEPGSFAAGKVPAALSAPVRLSQPIDLRFEQLAEQTGAVPVGDADVEAAFPALAGAIGLSAVRGLLATSQIVGMACPGLHSLFAGLDVNCAAAIDRQGALAYAVTKTDGRFRSLQIEVSGSGIAGRLDAFARPAPPSQPAMTEVALRVTGNPFVGQRSLIVGGSRGLGEVTAKIIAAGGGRPVITYRESKQEAERVSAEIVGAGGRCEIVRYDALKPARDQLETLGTVDSCYYFATPKIFQRKSKLYEPQRLRAFLGIYADGFADLCSTLPHGSSGKLAIFYPSTVAIDEAASATAEYAMAKIAGETLAKHLDEHIPDLVVICRRLPRILTDQTATIGVASADNALDVMLPIVYDVQRMARPTAAPRG